MKGWKLKNQNELVLEDIDENLSNDRKVKVKITKSLLNINDFHRFVGEIETSENVVLGSYGVGVICDADANLFGLSKGDRVFIEPKKPCEECYNCNSSKKESCYSPLIAGEDYDGFLRDFATFDIDSVYKLPNSVDEADALFINYISMAENIIVTLDINKGDYVSIVGVDNFSIILAQLLIYYQAVPIMICESEEEKEYCLRSNIYYTLSQNENILKEVSTITGGRMSDKVVYISESSLPVIKAFSIASYGANIAFAGLSSKVTSFSFNQAVKKQLKIYCINDTAKNTSTCINLLVNKAINTKHLLFKNIKFNQVNDELKSESTKLENNEKFVELLVDNME